jgi:hypothetical protein
MLYSQYLRIQTKAGGIAASNRDIIRAVRSMLKPAALTSGHKSSRHIIIKQALNHHKNQLKIGF